MFRYVELAGIGLRRAQVGKISFFDITASTGQLDPSDVVVRLLDSDGREVETKLFTLRNSLRCEYTIHQVSRGRLKFFKTIFRLGITISRFQ